MKYIYYIIAILVFSSAFIAYQLIGSRPSEQKAALMINKRIVSVDEFNKLYALRDPHLNKDEFINSLITKELLIQEARKNGIDREESFRGSIQKFYEQSLIKLLIDRKFASLKMDVTDGEAKRYASLLNERLHLTLFSFESPEAARASAYKDGEKRTISFQDLSKEMKDIVVALRDGEKSAPVPSGGRYVVVRLDKSVNIGSRVPSQAELTAIKKMLGEAKQERMMNEWIDSLRTASSIKILIDGNR